MKAKKEVVRKYYKYVDTAWTQPILTANGTMGGNSFACTASSYWSVYYPWFVFAGGNPGYGSAWFTTTTPSTYDWYSPEAIKITNIRIKNYTDVITEGTVLGSNDYSNWTTIKAFTNDITTAQAEWEIDLSDNTNLYKYHRINITKGSPTSCGIGRMYLTAYTRTIAPGTSSDYDFYKDEDEYKLSEVTERNYYKYVYEPFTQPILTANGTMGGDSFACTASSYLSVYYPYFVFASGEPGYGSGWATTTTQSTYDWYNPDALNITNIRIKNGTEAIYSITEGSVLGSNDYSTWTTLKTFTNSTTTALAEWNIDLSDNTGLYKYHRISTTKGNPTYIAIGRMYLTATTRELTPGTSSDYDIYIDTNKYYAMNF